MDNTVMLPNSGGYSAQNLCGVALNTGISRDQNPLVGRPGCCKGEYFTPVRPWSYIRTIGRKLSKNLGNNHNYGFNILGQIKQLSFFLVNSQKIFTQLCTNFCVSELMSMRSLSQLSYLRDHGLTSQINYMQKFRPFHTSQTWFLLYEIPVETALSLYCLNRVSESYNLNFLMNQYDYEKCSVIKN